MEPRILSRVYISCFNCFWNPKSIDIEWNSEVIETERCWKDGENFNQTYGDKHEGLTLIVVELYPIPIYQWHYDTSNNHPIHPKTIRKVVTIQPNSNVVKISSISFKLIEQ